MRRLEGLREAVAAGFTAVSIYIDDERVQIGDPDYIKMTDDIEGTVEELKEKYRGAKVTVTPIGEQEVMIEVERKKDSRISERSAARSDAPLKAGDRVVIPWAAPPLKGIITKEGPGEDEVTVRWSDGTTSPKVSRSDLELGRGSARGGRAVQERVASARSPEKFVLSIELGNEAMQTGEDVARALREVASKLDRGEDSGRVRDENGNTVGEWDLS